jgi:hypothetical protein
MCRKDGGSGWEIELLIDDVTWISGMDWGDCAFMLAFSR